VLTCREREAYIPSTMMRSCSLLALSLSAARGDYALVTAETDILASSSTLFNSLIASSVFSAVPGASTCLDRGQYAAALASAAPTWAVSFGATASTDFLTKLFVGDNFRTAFAFMAAGAVLADKNDHHPLWTNVYNSVNVSLSTDDRKCVSTFDIQLARGLDLVWANYSCGALKCGGHGVCAVADGGAGAVCACAPEWDGAACETAVPSDGGAAAATPFVKTPAGAAAIAVPTVLVATAVAAYVYAAQRRGVVGDGGGQMLSGKAAYGSI
jgi:4a-hydroxytetrahydrobiopterin dehydratase